ncbi:MAG TPA: alkaline phosphatase [Rubricoccaceae bacterium]|nr:alkaline phosphatase [Rubricoccaceae bacterium]
MRRLLLVFLLIPALAAAQERPRNVVLFIGDGFGPAFATMARQATGRPLALDGILAGSIGTASSTSEVTDSAAGATAYACALRTFDSAIAMDDARQPCRTILEAAEARGMATGLVATSRITHATPASFAAHVPDRDMEAEIAARMVKLGIEVLFGGGARFFTPEAIGGSRTDPHDLIEQARRAGVHVATSRAEYDALAAVPALALLADDHLAYELDRDETDEPSLAEMTRKALDLLSESEAGEEEGFFLMVEGSRIDHAAHGNDPAGTLGDVLAYDAAVAVALGFAREDGRTLVVGVSDHETGGLALGRDNVYDWQPAFLAAVSQTADRMADRLRAGEAPAGVLASGANVTTLTPAEEAALVAAMEGQPGPGVEAVVADVLSRRAGVGWTTGGHTAVDVPLYSFGPGSERLRGVMRNDAVGQALFDALDLETGR